MRNKPTSEELFEHYKEIAELAIDYAHRYVKYSSTYSFLHLNKQKRHIETINRMRSSINNRKPFKDGLLQYFDISDSDIHNTRLEKNAIKKYNAGNCGELSLLALYFCRKTNCPAEMVFLTNADHVFIVLNRLPNSDIKDPDTWGECAIVCDPLTKEVYAAKYFKTRMTGFKYDHNLPFPNIDIPYNQIKDPKLEIILATKQQTKKDMEIQLNLAHQHIQMIKSIIGKLSIDHENKEKIMYLLDQFSILTPEQESGHYIERQFHKYIKKMISVLYASYENKEIAERDLSHTIVELEFNETDKQYKQSDFLDILIFTGDSHCLNNIKYLLIQDNYLYNMLTIQDEQGESNFTKLILHYSMDDETYQFLYDVLGHEVYLELLQLVNIFGETHIDILSESVTDKSFRFFDELHLFLMTHETLVDTVSYNNLCDCLYQSIQNVATYNNTEVYHKILDILTEMGINIKAEVMEYSKEDKQKCNRLQIYLIQSNFKEVKNIFLLPIHELMSLLLHENIQSKTAFNLAAEYRMFTFFELLIDKLYGIKDKKTNEHYCEMIYSLTNKLNECYSPSKIGTKTHESIVKLKEAAAKHTQSNEISEKFNISRINK